MPMRRHLPVDGEKIHRQGEDQCHLHIKPSGDRIWIGRSAATAGATELAHNLASQTLVTTLSTRERNRSAKLVANAGITTQLAMQPWPVATEERTSSPEVVEGNHLQVQDDASNVEAWTIW